MTHLSLSKRQNIQLLALGLQASVLILPLRYSQQKTTASDAEKNFLSHGAQAGMRCDCFNLARRRPAQRPMQSETVEVTIAGFIVLLEMQQQPLWWLTSMEGSEEDGVGRMWQESEACLLKESH